MKVRFEFYHTDSNCYQYCDNGYLYVRDLRGEYLCVRTYF